MKIMIDTKHDTHEDIKKVIELLSTLVKKETANLFEQDATPDGLMGMFDVKEQAKMSDILPTKAKEPAIELY